MRRVRYPQPTQTTFATNSQAGGGHEKGLRVRAALIAEADLLDSMGTGKGGDLRLAAEGLSLASLERIGKSLS